MRLSHIDPSVKHDREITSITADSRAARPGALFAALPGTHSDGTSYIPDAIVNGAVAILSPRAIDVPDNVTLIINDNPRLLFSKIAAKFYARQPSHSVAVTGTNGKTSVVSFVKQLWTLLGHKAASIGTLGMKAPGVNKPFGLTTPDSAALHAMLADLSAAGVDHLAMEASSHGLDQYRLDGVKLSAAAFTNLTRDHLDYHGSMEKYLDAKARLFSEVLPEGSTAVINQDTPEFETLANGCRMRNIKVIGFGERGSDIKLQSAEASANGQKLNLSVFGKNYVVDLSLIGQFQAWNALAALGLVLADGANADDVVPLLSKLTSVRGRIEYVGQTRDGAGVFIDYAHTPNALEIILHALRHHTQNKLWVVFGCGGNRDKGKRAIMGKIADELADKVIVTDDNPRFENADEIRREIVANCPKAKEIGDRSAAILYAVQHLQAGDVLVIAGKGHEQGQIIGDEIKPFDDFAVAQGALQSIS